MKAKLALLISGTILFYIVFWNQNLGINSLLFSIFTIGISVFLYPESLKSKMALIISSGIIISSLTIVYHASDLAIFVWIASLFLLPAYIHNTKLKTIIFGGIYSLSYFIFPAYLKEIVKGARHNSKIKRFSKISKIIKLVAIPLVFVYIFYWIFKFANPVFDEITNTIFSKINTWFLNFFVNFSILQILFIIWGFTFFAWIIYKFNSEFLIKNESKLSDFIQRKRNKKNENLIYATKLNLGLKNEFKSAIMLIFMVNVLLLIINILDITYIWFGFEYTKGMNLTQLVHEGTYYLIFSILLSMGIMLFFFRRNLNFYKKNKVLKILSYIWITQNAILLISVIFRNLHYIHYFGLAYKRIGLFFFLTMVVVGLISLALKIKDKNTTFYLLKINSLAIYIGFVFFAIPDWDNIIAHHNLSSKTIKGIDTEFLISLDEKTLPIIIENKDKLNETYFINYFLDGETKNTEMELKSKSDIFIMNYEEKSWLSWNYADSKAYNYLKSNEEH